MNKKKLVVTGLVGVIGLLSLSVSFTLAWYASSTFMQVKEIETEFDTDRDLKISTSADLDTFKDKLTTEADNLNKTIEFRPVSSMFSSLWMGEKANKPLFRDSSSSFVGSTGEPFLVNVDSGFYSQELYLLTDDDMYVTISKTKSTFSADKEKNKERAKTLKELYPSKNEAQIEEELDKLVNCLRVSVLVPDEECYSYTIIDPTKEGNTMMGGRLDNSKSGYYDYYHAEDGNSYEIIYGETINKDKAVYNTPSDEDTSITGEPSAFNAKTHRNVYSFDYEKSKQNGFDFKEEGAYSLSSIDNGDMSVLKIPCYRNQPRKIVLSIYLEGWDKDCINNTMAGSFNCDISFKLIREFVE